jgi:divalent metal cation (Fe/Co/Zn/Cd) transporter
MVVVTVLVAGAGLGWLAWAAIFHANPAVDADVASFDVKSAHRVDATVQVRVRDSDSSGSCLLRASAQDHSVVGEHRFRVDSSTGQETTVRVRTERRAVTIEVVDCTAAKG